jgi:hypothetical protein
VSQSLYASRRDVIGDGVWSRRSGILFLGRASTFRGRLMLTAYAKIVSFRQTSVLRQRSANKEAVNLSGF